MWIITPQQGWHKLCIAQYKARLRNLIADPGDLPMSYLKTKFLSPLEKYGPKYAPWVKYGVLALGMSIWLFALVDQLYTSANIMKYLLMSLIILAIAMI